MKYEGEYGVGNLDREILAEVKIMNGGRQSLPKSWLIGVIFKRHDQISGEDEPFATCAMYYTITKRVEDTYRRIKATETENVGQEELFPGYKHLHKRYLVKREGEQVVVPIQFMTDEEIDVKAGQLEAMRTGLEEHIEELRRYKETRLKTEVAV